MVNTTDETTEATSITIDQLPDSWILTTLGEVSTKPQYGYTTSAVQEGKGPKFLRITDLSYAGVNWNTVPYCQTPPKDVGKYRLKTGDIVIARSGSVGKAYRIVDPPEAVFASYLIRFKTILVLDKYVAYFLQSQNYWEQIAESSSGNTIYNVNATKMARLRIPLAPLKEQARIIEAIEVLFSRLDAGIAALKRVQKNLKRYKASVLKAACEGELVPQNPDDEPASELLASILDARRAKWEAEELAKYDAKGQKPPKNWRDRYQEPHLPDTSDLPELPEGWIWVRVDTVGDVKLGRQRAPQHHQGEHMRPYLRVANVFEDYIDTSDVMEMNFTPKEYEIYRLEYGDILLNEGQSLELVGRPAIFRDEVPGACFQNTLVRFKSSNAVFNEYALLVFRAYLRSGRFQQIASWTTSIAHLGAGRFSALEFPLPPIEEQERIVEEFDAISTTIDHLAQAVDASIKRAERLRQSVLKDAFSGKLVSQDPDDEPASVLLDRIRAERET